MDADRFDALSRVLGTQSRRRGMFKAAAGGALGLVGLAGLTDSAGARRCSNDNDCSRNDVCRSKQMRRVQARPRLLLRRPVR